jgi:L-alanine-DL-glutamate epimerase-like enolase superfamily enzyme
MKITHVRTVLCSAPYRNERIRRARQVKSAAFVLIETDTELTGLGETYAGHFIPEQVPGMVEFYAPILIGADPLDLDVLYHRMFMAGKFWGRVGLGSIVLSGIEMALLDLKGKALAVPVYELLGGRCHDTLRAYASGGYSYWPEEKFLGALEHHIEAGFDGVKLGAGLYESAQKPNLPGATPGEAAAIEVMKAELMRKHFGKGIQLLLDGHMDAAGENDHVWNEAMAAAVLQALAPYGVGFFEEPLPYTDKRAYCALRKRSTIPVAGGECLTSLEEWRDWMLAEPAFDLAQLDAAFMGGLINFIKIAHLCELHGGMIATHCNTAAVGLAGNLHAAFACRNTRLLEMHPFNLAEPARRTHIDCPLLTELWIAPPEMKNSRIRLADTPGLGVRLPADFINRYPYQPGSGEFVPVKGKPGTS